MQLEGPTQRRRAPGAVYRSVQTYCTWVQRCWRSQKARWTLQLFATKCNEHSSKKQFRFFAAFFKKYYFATRFKKQCRLCNTLQKRTSDFTTICNTLQKDTLDRATFFQINFHFSGNHFSFREKSMVKSHFLSRNFL